MISRKCRPGHYLYASVYFLTKIGDILLQKGEFIEDFNYDKWQKLVAAGKLDATNVLTIENENEKEKENNNGEDAE